MIKWLAIDAFALLVCSTPAAAKEKGHVDTLFKLIGRTHEVVVETFDDPKVNGVTCLISMARKGGVNGNMGCAEETSDASVDCRR